MTPDPARQAAYEVARRVFLGKPGDKVRASNVDLVVDAVWDLAVEEGRRLVRAEVGICGDLSPTLIGFDDRRVSCDLLAGHDGWHSHPNEGGSRMSWMALDPEVAEVVADTIERWTADDSIERRRKWTDTEKAALERQYQEFKERKERG